VKLRVRAFGIAAGVVVGLVFCFVMIMSITAGSGQTVRSIRYVLPLYERNLLGVAVGLVGGFIEGFLVGAFFAWVYNKFHKMLYGSAEASNTPIK
jgi:hypothetical protein